MSNAYMWLGEEKVHFTGINEDPAFRPDLGYNKPRKNVDRWVIGEQWHLFDKADIVIAHNGDKFDQKKTQAQFMVHGLGPTAPYKQIDTLKEVRRYANFASNRLNDLGIQLGLGEKEGHSGMAMWFGCMAGEAWAWEMNKKYNVRDVLLLRDLYLELMPWIGTPGKVNPGGHAAAYDDGRPTVCPKIGCGGTQLIARAKRVQASGLRYTVYSCKKCGGYCQSRYADGRALDGPRVK